MFIIRAEKTILGLLKKVLKAAGMKLEFARHAGCLCISEDPTPHIPAKFNDLCNVTKIPEDVPFIGKSFKKSVYKIEPPICNSPIAIISGLYKGRSGILISAESNKCKVEITLDGRIISATVNLRDIEETKAPWD
jgi:hypothetical protein